jgi:hypothetical protein
MKLPPIVADRLKQRPRVKNPKTEAETRIDS